MDLKFRVPPEATIRQIMIDMIEHGINPALRMNNTTKGEFFNHIGSKPELMQLYLANQQIRAEVLADEIVGLADDDFSDIDRTKVKILARQWFSSRILYRKYGDKLSVEHIQVVDIKGAIEEAKARVNQTFEHKIETKPTLVIPTDLEYLEPNLEDEGDRENEKLRVSGPTSLGRHIENKNPDTWAEQQIKELPPQYHPPELEELKEDEIDIFS